MKKFSVQQVSEIVANGGGIAIDATKLAFQDLKMIAGYAGGSGKHPRVRILNASALKFEEIRELAAYGQGCISFEE